jgi:TolB protein
MDESPSIAPNGTMLVYATISGRRSTLAAVSVDGGVKYQIPTVSGEVRMPAWSPFPPK